MNSSLAAPQGAGAHLLDPPAPADWSGLPLFARLAYGRVRSAANIFGWVLLLAGIILLCGQALVRVDPQDEGQFLTYPWLISQGHVPYMDIWMSYPPGMYILVTFFLKLGIPGLIAERGVGLISRIIFVLLVNRLATRNWRRFSWLVVPVAFSLDFIASDVKAYPWISALPLLFLALCLVRKRPCWAASFFLVAGTFRFEFAAAGCVALVTMAIMQRAMRRPAARFALAGLALTIGFAATYLLLNAVTDGAAIQQIFTDQIVYAELGRKIGLFPPAFGPLGIPIAPLTLLAPIFMLIVGARARQSHVVATNLAVLTLIPHFFQRADASHLFSTAVITVAWMLVGITRDLLPANGIPGSTAPASRLVQAFAWISLGLGGFYALIVAAYGAYLSPLSPLASDGLATLPNRTFGSGTHVLIAGTTREAAEDRAVVAYLHAHSRLSDSVFIAPLSFTSAYTRTDLYYAIGLPPAGRFLEVQPGVQTRSAAQRDIIRGLQRCVWVVLLHGGTWYAGPDIHHVPSSDLVWKFTRTTFHIVMQNPTYLLLRRNT